MTTALSLASSWHGAATAVAFLVITTQTMAFSSPSVFSLPHMKCRDVASFPTSLNLKRPVGGRHFQLEELEDAEASTTDVLLNTDMTVTLGGTNGPLYVDSYGAWSEHCVFLGESEENFKRLFEMKLTRKFVAGAEGSDHSSIGEFEYSVERTYRGECCLIGGSVFAMNGEILDVDEIFGERRLGFFNMIDTSDERENMAIE